MLQDLNDDDDNSSKIYTNIMLAHEEAAKKHIPVKNRVKQHVPWENDNIIAKRKAVRDALNEATQRKTRSSAKKLKDASK